MTKQRHVFNDVHKGWPVPSTINPEERLYVCLSVPNDPTHISNFLGAMFELMRWTNYRRTNDTRGKQTADVWRTIWEAIEFSLEDCNDMCCDEQTNLLIQLLNAQRSVQYSAWRNADDGTPQSFAPDAPEDWDSDPSDDTPERVQARGDALCAAVTTYVVNALSSMAQSTAITAIALAGLSGLLPGWGLAIAVSTLVGAVALIGALSNTEAVREVICCMLAALRGNDCDMASFQHSLDACDLSGDAETIRSFMAGANSNPDNYRAFTAQLGTFYSAAYSDPAGVPDCTCCEISPSDVIWWDNSNPYYPYTEPTPVLGETDRYLVTSVSGLINGGSEAGYIIRFAVDPAQCYRLSDLVIEGISGSGYAARFDCDMASHEGFIPASNPLATDCGKYWIAEGNTPWTLEFTIAPECCE